MNLNVMTSTRTPYIPKSSCEVTSNWVILSGFSKYSTRQDVMISLNEIKYEIIDAMIDKYSNMQGTAFFSLLIPIFLKIII